LSEKGDTVTDLYPIMKGRAAQLARTLIGDKPGEDLLALIMSDSDDPNGGTPGLLN
jgi:hypothetical protein